MEHSQSDVVCCMCVSLSANLRTHHRTHSFDSESLLLDSLIDSS